MAPLMAPKPHQFVGWAIHGYITVEGSGVLAIGRHLYVLLLGGVLVLAPSTLGEWTLHTTYTLM